MTIGRKIGLGFGFPLLILIAIAVLAVWSTTRLNVTSHWVTHTHQVLENIEALLSALKDAETGQRGYLITGKESYLEPYKSAVSETDRLLAGLKHLTADSPVQLKRWEEVRSPIASKLAELKSTIALRKEQGFEAAREVVSDDQGKEAMDEIRKILAEATAHERELLKTRGEEAETSFLIANSLIGVGTGIAVLLMALNSASLTRSITRTLREAFSQLTTASTELLASTAQQATGAQEQSSSITETVATVDEVSQTAGQAAERARKVGDNVQHNFEIGQAGRRAIEDSIRALNLLKKKIESTAASILDLSGQAEDIGEIITVVNEISEQTNILALNAAIEASRAGEFGKGFAIIATDVKALAEQSKKATVQVRQILGQIVKATNTAVRSTEEVTKGMDGAIKANEDSSAIVNTLTDTLADAAQAAMQIVASAGQQATGMAQINLAMKNLEQVARQYLTATLQVEQAARNLNTLGSQLSALT